MRGCLQADDDQIQSDRQTERNADHQRVERTAQRRHRDPSQRGGESAGMRRQPTQERALQTIEAIFGATAQIVENDGEAALTTNRVAQVAGDDGLFAMFFRYGVQSCWLLPAVLLRRTIPIAWSGW